MPESELNDFIKRFQTLITTLIVNGFHLDDIDRVSPSCTILHIFKYDVFAAKIWYSIIFTDNVTNSIVQRASRGAKNGQTTIFGIGHNSSPICDWYSSDDFYKKIGGEVNETLIINPDLSILMKGLGLNKVPIGVDGKAEDLLELYTKDCLQYLLKVPVRRYGIDRLFESLPDGVVLGKGLIIMQFDAKAYSDGFSFDSDFMLRIQKYIEEFNSKYESIIGRVNSFLIISGKFNDSDSSLHGRYTDLIAKCQTPLCCIESEDLGKIVQLFLKNPSFRLSLDWKLLFTKTRLKYSDIETALNKVKKDGIITN